MNLLELKKALDQIPNVGHVYGSFKENQEVPYITYEATEENPIFCDGKIIYSESTITMNLVTRQRDCCAESFIENLLDAFRTQYNKTYAFDNEQKTHTVTYTFTIE